MREVNRNHKDTIFRDLFGSPEGRGNALSLYNALSGSHYEDADELEILSLDNVVFLGRRNDVSFIIDGVLPLWEHQSTMNRNMPLRGLLYIARLYERYLEARGLDVHSTRRLALPAPRFVVFYNGEDECPDRSEQRLSEAFSADGGCVEVVATVLNVNAGRNAVLMGACEVLAQYAELVNRLRRAAQACGD